VNEERMRPVGWSRCFGFSSVFWYCWQGVRPAMKTLCHLSPKEQVEKDKNSSGDEIANVKEN